VGINTTTNAWLTKTFQGGVATITSKQVGKDSILIISWEDARHSVGTGESNSIYDIYSATIDRKSKIESEKELSTMKHFTPALLAA
jgi:hypothetical protein